MGFNSFSLSSSQVEEFEQIAKKINTTAGYKWLPSNELPSAIPETLRNKIPYACLMWEYIGSSALYLVFNNYRIDQKDNALDQEPFGMIIKPSGASTYGIFYHHGNWPDRTSPITPEVRKALESTSLCNYFPLVNEVSQNSSGPLADLKGTSNEWAFKKIIDKLINENSA